MVVDLEYARKCLMQDLEKEWERSAQTKTKLDLYRNIKSKFGVEKYLLLNIDKYEVSLLSQLRYGILPLRIETGRFTNERREDRICANCETNTVETVEHFLFECSLFDSQRLHFINSVHSSIDNWDNLTYDECLKQLFDV